MEKKEIKLKIDKYIYDIATEYKIDIEELLYDKLLDKSYSIKREIEQEKLLKELKELEDYWTVLKIIKRISKESKFKYASESYIIAKAELKYISKEETKEALKELMERKQIFQPIKSNYQVIKVKQNKKDC